MATDRRDQMVAEVIRRVRPAAAAAHGSADAEVADLVSARITIDDRLDDVWHLIGMGPASVQAFEALRSTLAADIDRRFRSRLPELAASEQQRIIDSIDAAVSLSAVRALRHERRESNEETVRILSGAIRRTLAARNRQADRSGPAHELQGTH